MLLLDMSIECWVTQVGLGAVAAFEITTLDVVLGATFSFATAILIVAAIVVAVVITAIGLLTLGATAQVWDLALVFAHADDHLIGIWR